METFRICAAFDTETTNIGQGEATRAFCVCYQVNDFRNIEISEYKPDESDDIRIYRYVHEMELYLEDLISWGRSNDVIPIVCGYNLMFDLETLRVWVDNYKCEVNAQSSTNVYTIDLMQDGKKILRFWDTYHLELTGLAAMGETAGLPKLNGDWDYSRIRTPETPLTDEEIGYASRDVQVIPAYLKYVLDSNPWATSEMLGCRILTKSSIVRQMAANEIFPLEQESKKGRKYKIGVSFELLCRNEMAKDYKTYALRRACFRGGLTFTAAANASKPIRNVCSLDVTSMHHLFINGRMVPQEFRKCPPRILNRVVQNTLDIPVSKVLERYWKPFPTAFHARIRFTNLRMRKGSAFERYGIAVLASAKFDLSGIFAFSYFGENDAARTQNVENFNSGWHDAAKGKAVIAFGKVMECECLEVHVSELELYLMELVYEWDSYKVICGEVAMRFYRPPQYVVLQSNILFNRKNDMKKVNKSYMEGIPLPFPVPDSIPDSIAEGLRAGTLTRQFVEAYYNSSVKGAFNGIYGTQAQDVMKPGYTWYDSEVCVDESKRTTEANYKERIPKKLKVLYTYGLRIVGGSRLHLALAIKMLYEAFGNRLEFIGGDTDSLKIGLDGVRPEDIMVALEPLHLAAHSALSVCQETIHRNFPQYASDLKGVGEFDLEPATPDNPLYEWGMEAWNKCRILFDGKRNHVTMAGVSRPRNTVNVESFADMLYEQGMPFEKYAPKLLGYNMYIPPEISHSLEKHRPKPGELYTGYIKDWRGVTTYVSLRQAVALYPAGRLIGDTVKPANRRNVTYLRHFHDRIASDSMKMLVYNVTAQITNVEL